MGGGEKVSESVKRMREREREEYSKRQMENERAGEEGQRGKGQMDKDGMGKHKEDKSD